MNDGREGGDGIHSQAHAQLSKMNNATDAGTY